MKIYRAMKMADDGLPEVGRSARQLGIRTGADVAAGVEPDVLVIDPAATLKPGEGGLSVAPHTPLNLPPLRRPASLAGGRGKDPVWVIDTATLADAGVQFRQDSPTHGLLEPLSEMTLAEFEAALARTRNDWMPAAGVSEEKS